MLTIVYHLCPPPPSQLWRTLQFESPPVQSFWGPWGRVTPKYTTLSVWPPVSSSLLKRLLAMFLKAVNLQPRGSLFALFTLPNCHLAACDIYSTFIQSCAKWMDFIGRDLFLFFSLPLVSSPFRVASLCVCVFSRAEADTSTYAALPRCVTLPVRSYFGAYWRVVQLCRWDSAKYWP